MRSPIWIALFLATGVHVAALYKLFSHEHVVSFEYGQQVPIKVTLIAKAEKSQRAQKPPPHARRYSPAPMSTPKKPVSTGAGQASRVSDAPPPTLVEQRLSSPPPSGASINMDDIVRNVRRDAGAIEREMRQAAPNRNPSWEPHSPQEKFAQAVKAAGIQCLLTTETITLAGGRKMTRVKGPNGTYCVEMEANHGVDGVDHIQNGVRMKTTTCPR